MPPPGVDNAPLYDLSAPPHSPSLKSALRPPCAVFPDSLPSLLKPPRPSPPSPLPLPSLPSSPPTRANHYDHFRWASQPVPLSDLSAPAPLSSHLDPHPVAPQAHLLGAWYPFHHGLHTPVGTALFHDHHPPPSRRPRIRTTTLPDHHQPSPKSSWTQCFPTQPSSSSSSAPAPAPPPCDHPSSDSEDLSDRDVWDQQLQPMVIFSMTPAPPPTQPDTPQLTEITADMAAAGVDVQGIPWNTLSFSRADYRATRLSDQTGDRSDFADGPKFLKEPTVGASFFDFFSNARSVKCSIVHFQLRNLAWATSKHDVYVMHDASVVHWNSTSKQKSLVLDLSGSGSSVGVVQISTMIAREDLVIAGGFYGEMVAKNMRTGSIIHNKRITYHENAITNAIDIFDDTIMTSNNDCYVRSFDIETFKRTTAFSFATPVNHATRQPHGKMVAVAGDENAIQVMDGDSGDRISQLHGHDHYSFATAWHPNGRLFATGSQDRTCRVWDVRNMAQSVCVLGAHMGAVRSLRFSACGRFMVMAEPRDFVHVFDVNGGEFDTCQEIDLFGEIAGIALTPEAESLYIAVSDRLYSSLLEYERRSSPSLAEAIF